MNQQLDIVSWSTKKVSNYIPKELVNQLAIKAQKGDVTARNQLILSFLPLAKKVARQYTKRSQVCFEQLVNVALLGVVDATKTYNIQKGHFSWHVRDWLNYVVKEEVRIFRHQVKLGERQIALISRIELTEQQLRQKGEKYIDDQMIAKKLGLSLSKVIKCRRLTQFEVPLDKPIYKTESGDLCLIDITPGFELNPEESLIEKNESEFKKQALRQALIKLDKRQLYIIMERKLKDYDRGEKIKSLAAIGKEMGLSTERVRQIEVQALKILHKELCRTVGL